VLSFARCLALALALFLSHALYANQLAQDDSLPTRPLDKKPKWAKPRTPHGKASSRSHTKAEAVELAADQAEQRSRWADNHTARPGTPESDIEDVTIPNTSPLADDSQGGTTIALPIRTPERLQGPDLIPALASEPQGTPEAQV
jgi:hypothetical protein